MNPVTTFLVFVLILGSAEAAIAGLTCSSE